MHVASKENVSLKATLLNLPVLAKLQSLFAAGKVCSNEVSYLLQWFSVQSYLNITPFSPQPVINK